MNGAVATMIMSFDIWQAGLPRMEIYGSEGTLRVPDPNWFGGLVQLWRHYAREWRVMPRPSLVRKSAWLGCLVKVGRASSR